VGLSNHAPILLTTGIPSPPSKRPFKCELGWLQRDDFHDMVKTILERPVTGQTPIARWNNKMCALRKHISGWASHVTSILRK
jgi:hypothetical protein